MEEKNVSFIRSLVSHNGERAGSVMQINAVAKLAEEPQSCPICGGTGWKGAVSAGERRVTRCDCFLQTQAKHLLDASEIPARYVDCEFLNYETGANEGISSAKIKIAAWSSQYPIDRSGLLLIGPSGVGKTHLSVAALKQLAQKGVHCLFCDYRELLKKIQNSYNPSVQTTELDLLRPIFETEVVLLDDLGAVKPSEWVWDTVSLILNARYNDKLTTIITSNFLDGPSAAAERMDGPRRAAREETLGDRIGERMRSRLFEMCRLVLVNGKDYRHKFRQR
ncbi:MAG: ATP-binding protein [Terriglobales bacterium]